MKKRVEKTSSRHYGNKSSNLPTNIVNEICDKNLGGSDLSLKGLLAGKVKVLSRKSRRALKREIKGKRAQESSQNAAILRRTQKFGSKDHIVAKKGKGGKAGGVVQGDRKMVNSDSEIIEINDTSQCSASEEVNDDRWGDSGREEFDDSRFIREKKLSRRGEESQESGKKRRLENEDKNGEPLKHNDVRHAERKLGISEGKASDAKRRKLYKELTADGFDDDLFGFLDEVVEGHEDKEKQTFVDENVNLKKDKSKLKAVDSNVRAVLSKGPSTTPLLYASQKEKQVSSQRYVPPHLRKPDAYMEGQRQEYVKQLNGAVNRLAEGNISVVTKEIVRIFDAAKMCIVESVRKESTVISQEETQQKIESFLGKLIDETVQRSIALCILHPLAGASLISCQVALICGLSVLISPKLSVDFFSSTARLFGEHFDAAMTTAANCLSHSILDSDKTIARHAVLAVSYFFDFGMLDVDLLYGFIRRLAENFGEVAMDLIVLCLRFVGIRLRTESPDDFRDILEFLSVRVAEFSADADPSKGRLRFLIQDISNLRNTKNRTAELTAERLAPLRNWLISSDEFSTTDLSSFIIRGDWSKIEQNTEVPLVTASADFSLFSVTSNNNRQTIAGGASSHQNSLLTKASELRINLDIQKSFFLAIMGADDQFHATCRILEVIKNKSHVQHAIAVLMHCCLNERFYNPFYFLLTKELCQMNPPHSKRFQKALREGVASQLGICYSHTPRKLFHFTKFVASLIHQELLPFKILRFLKLKDSVEQLEGLNDSKDSLPKATTAGGSQKTSESLTPSNVDVASKNLAILRQIGKALLSSGNIEGPQSGNTTNEKQSVINDCLSKLDDVPDVREWMRLVFDSILSDAS